MTRCSGIPKIYSPWWPKKWTPRFFYKQIHFKTNFWSKTPKKHFRNLVKPIHDLSKMQKTDIKSKINPKPKIFPYSNMFFFFWHFQGKKMPLVNSSYHMELFDIKINCFGGHNCHQRSLFLSTLESNNSISLLQTERDEK